MKSDRFHNYLPNMRARVFGLRGGSLRTVFTYRGREERVKGKNRRRPFRHRLFSVMSSLHRGMSGLIRRTKAAPTFRHSQRWFARASHWRNYSIVRVMPSSNSHLRFPAEDFFRARDVGLAHLRVVHRSGLYSIPDFVPVMRMISSANCLIVISRGLPMLTGSWKSDCERRKIPSIKSET